MKFLIPLFLFFTVLIWGCYRVATHKCALYSDPNIIKETRVAAVNSKGKYGHTVLDYKDGSWAMISGCQIIKRGWRRGTELYDPETNTFYHSSDSPENPNP